MSHLKSFLACKWKLLTVLLVFLLLAGGLLYIWYLTHLTGPTPAWMIPKASQHGVGGTATLSAETVYKDFFMSTTQVPEPTDWLFFRIAIFSLVKSYCKAQGVFL